MVRFYPSAMGILVAVVGSVAMLVSATSMMVVLLVALCGVMHLGTTQGMMGKWVC